MYDYIVKKQILSVTNKIKFEFRAGGMLESVFSLVAATLGAGTVAFPYAIEQNGIIFGALLIAFGGAVSIYTGNLLIQVSDRTNRFRYEDFAYQLYGRKMAIFSSIVDLLCMMGFIIAYIVFVKRSIPRILYLFMSDLPKFMNQESLGQFFWSGIFSVKLVFLISQVILTLLSIPREIKKLRYFSMLGVLCSCYLSIAVLFLFSLNRDITPHPKINIQNASYFKVFYIANTLVFI